jgi:hypothetical protein
LSGWENLMPQRNSWLGKFAFFFELWLSFQSFRGQFFRRQVFVLKTNAEIAQTPCFILILGASSPFFFPHIYIYIYNTFTSTHSNNLLVIIIFQIILKFVPRVFIFVVHLWACFVTRVWHGIVNWNATCVIPNDNNSVGISWARSLKVWDSSFFFKFIPYIVFKNFEHIKCTCCYLLLFLLLNLFCTSDAFNAHVMFKDFHLLFDGTFLLNFCVHECCPLVDHGNNVGGPMKCF